MEYKKIKPEINNFVNDNLKALEQLFPNVVKDGEVDFEALKEELGQFKEVEQEKYEFTWTGKQEAKKLAQTDIVNRTLRYVPEDSVNADKTENLYIEGDNLEVLKLLRQNYYGSIKMIYIDPPYNTGSDFIYNDDFEINSTEYEQLEGTMNQYGERMTANPKGSGRYHSGWLSLMYPRLKIARDFLTDDGVIIINIDENEITNLQKICNEIFGEENDLGTIIWDKRNPKGDAKGISIQHEYILFYTKNKDVFLQNNKVIRPKKNAQKILQKANQLFAKISSNYLLEQANRELSLWMNTQHDFTGGEKAYCKIDENGDVYRSVSMAWPNKKQAPADYLIPLIHPVTKEPCPIPERGWRNPSATMQELLKNNLILFGKDHMTQPTRKYLLKENMYENIPSLLYYGGSDVNLLKELDIPFDTPKVLDIVTEHISTFTSGDDIIMDFFSGSATTAHGVMGANVKDNGNRKFIMIQLPENIDEKNEAYKAGYKNICEIGKERIRRAGNKIKEFCLENNTPVPDTGFKVFRSGDTNIKWNLENIVLNLFNEDIDNIDFIEGFNDIDVVYEIMLHQKDVPLYETIETLTNIGNRTYLYASSYLICLEKEITNDMIEKLAGLEPLPLKFVFRDSAFKDDLNLKDETFRRLNSLIEKNSCNKTTTYTVEFI